MLKLQQHLGTFLLSSTKITSENNLPFQVEEIVLDDIEQCQQNTHFVRNFLNDLRNNALGNFEKSPDATEIATCHTMSTIIQQFILNDTLIPLPNIFIPPSRKIIIRLYLSPAMMKVFKN